MSASRAEERCERSVARTSSPRGGIAHSVETHPQSRANPRSLCADFRSLVFFLRARSGSREAKQRIFCLLLPAAGWYSSRHEDLRKVQIGPGTRDSVACSPAQLYVRIAPSLRASRSKARRGGNCSRPELSFSDPKSLHHPEPLHTAVHPPDVFAPFACLPEIDLRGVARKGLTRLKSNEGHGVRASPPTILVRVRFPLPQGGSYRVRYCTAS